MHPLVPKYDLWINRICWGMVGSLGFAGLGYATNSALLWWSCLLGAIFALGLMCAALWITRDLQHHFETAAGQTEGKPWYRP